jgi:RNA polymerase sigma factor (TIGR02999 family)
MLTPKSDESAESAESEITQLTKRVQSGDAAACDELVNSIYPKLHQIARRTLAAHRENTLLNVTSLLHETLEKLIGKKFSNIENSRHLVAYCASVMRTILVDHVREKGAQKRDGGERVTLTGLEIALPDTNIDLIALDEALNRLSELDPRLTAIVEQRCFAGLRIDEIAAETGVSERTIKRDWQKARAFLMHYFSSDAK